MLLFKKWVGDYTAGDAWDVDAAEHIAWDPDTMQMFVGKYLMRKQLFLTTQKFRCAFPLLATSLISHTLSGGILNPLPFRRPYP